MHTKRFNRILAAAAAASLALTAMTGCAQTAAGVSESTEINTDTSITVEVTDEITSTNDSEHAIEVSGETAEYSNIKVTKTGDSEAGDEADFYGDNAAIFATDGATLTLENIVVETDGLHANAVFSYGEGTTINISDSVITTSGNCSGGLMTTGGGTMNATNLDIHTTGNSSAAIRSDRGGGTVTVTGGTYTTDGKGSPVIYSTADITVNDAALTSTSSQGVVVEGKNSVTLNNVTLVADNNSKNSDKSEWYQAVMIYQSMSGDAAVGAASFTMNGGSLTNVNGDVFFVNNTVTTITLDNVEIVNEDADGVFLRAAAAGWGTEGSNGGKVDLYLNSQTLEGDIIVDEVSALNMHLASGTVYTGTVNGADSDGAEIYVGIESGSRWVLTGDSYITSLTCDSDGIELNGHKLYVGGVLYSEGSASDGTAIEMVTAGASGSGASGAHQAPDGAPGEPPSGDPPSGGSGDGSDRPERPEGDPPSGDPPARPDGDSGEPPAKPE
ncbi:hypothetical protein SAMN02910456_02262 [Ruminococcaceae bacterium YRB3002]|nr:hypothetical protein SAMN02910456_02262 [Ruminococcaceae bacterium YRB3002]